MEVDRLFTSNRRHLKQGLQQKKMR